MNRTMSQILYGIEFRFRQFRLRVTGAQKLIDQIEDALENDMPEAARAAIYRLRHNCGETVESARLQARLTVYEVMQQMKRSKNT